MTINIPKFEDLPKYDSPPVVETVLGIQFEPLISYRSAHAGWYWKNYLDEKWGSIKEVPFLQDQFELFGDKKKWGSGIGFSVETIPASRHQIIRTDNTRMLQIQNSRFIYNWKLTDGNKKKKGLYPSYEKIEPEFHQLFDSFKKFSIDSGNEELNINQWEVTYVNYIEKGQLWETVADWPDILPWLSFPATDVMQQKPDGVNTELLLMIGENYGRLHVTAQRVRIGSDKGPEAISLKLTARGPINDELGIDYRTGFKIGHASIVQSFHSMISKEARVFWGFKGE